MKVHVTLRTKVTRDDEHREEAIRQLVDRFGMRAVNERRLARYGVLTGEIDAARLSELRESDLVESVEADSTQRAI